MSGTEALRVTGYIKPGKYVGGVYVRRGLEPTEEAFPKDFNVQLFKDDVLMSDAWYVLEYLKPLISYAHGSVLLIGLGLGCAIRGLIRKPEVTSVHVMELEPDIIVSISPYYPGIDIFQGDCLTKEFPPETKYDTIWCDCWEGGDPMYQEYLNKYTPMLNPGGWIGNIEADPEEVES